MCCPDLCWSLSSSGKGYTWCPKELLLCRVDKLGLKLILLWASVYARNCDFERGRWSHPAVANIWSHWYATVGSTSPSHSHNYEHTWMPVKRLGIFGELDLTSFLIISWAHESNALFGQENVTWQIIRFYFLGWICTNKIIWKR